MDAERGRKSIQCVREGETKTKKRTEENRTRSKKTGQGSRCRKTTHNHKNTHITQHNVCAFGSVLTHEINAHKRPNTERHNGTEDLCGDNGRKERSVPKTFQRPCGRPTEQKCPEPDAIRCVSARRIDWRKLLPQGRPVATAMPRTVRTRRCAVYRRRLWTRIAGHPCGEQTQNRRQRVHNGIPHPTIPKAYVERKRGRRKKGTEAV